LERLAILPPAGGPRIAAAAALPLDRLIAKFVRTPPSTPIPVQAFPAQDAYRPLPTLVQAARELFQRRELRRIHRARAATDPAVAGIGPL
jgi:hypothetical protein